MSYSAIVLADSPQAYYRCGESAGTIAYDSTANQYNAAYTGTFTLGQAGAITGDPNTGVQLNGTSGTIILPYSRLNYTTFSAVTLEYWVYQGSVWTYLVATLSNVTGQTVIYANGSIATPVAQSPLEISSLLDFAGSYQTATLDEIALYNYVLTPAQIQNHYSAAANTGTGGGTTTGGGTGGGSTGGSGGSTGASTPTLARFPGPARRGGLFPTAVRRGS